MQRQLGSVMHIGKRIVLNDDKGVLAGVLIALIVVAATVAAVAVYSVWFGPKPEAYSSISLLDTQQQAINYPTVLVANQNSSFSVYVQVGNHQNEDKDKNYQVQVKIAENLPASIPNGVLVEPISTVDLAVPDGQTLQTQVLVSENTVGAHSVVFELWMQDASDNYVFTQNFCVLNIEVVN